MSEQEKGQILSHELGHIHEGHTWDLLFYQILTILFWFNPAIHSMRAALMDVHKFSADQYALNHLSDSQSYSILVAKMALEKAGIPIGHQFGKPSTLKRIEMIKKTGNINWLKVFGVIPLSIFLLALVSLKPMDKRPLLSYLFHQPVSIIKKPNFGCTGFGKSSRQNQKIKDTCPL
ncbi:M56 family metallopeptidase [Echinicola jeungdonensis]|uniref:M56 family metallopeptidase n=1 Tax=Echinicola jeungdonensis TaxID=709343 RepID=A0ABV5J6U4_9BACT|nr:M56 family metallopeptidase [Echinicola jeungdonensis]MDN3670931.1 M56 family metallopeptidase [Echinicola jeungdonensis]